MDIIKETNLTGRYLSDAKKLQALCEEFDHILLKTELDYKYGDGTLTPNKKGYREFLAYEGEILLGYLGICTFGGSDSPYELTGMVHPDYRRRRILTSLVEEAEIVLEEEAADNVLYLCDRTSQSGWAFLKQLEVKKSFSEYEMYLRKDFTSKEPDAKLSLRKATNQDAREIAHMNALFFGDVFQEGDAMMLPEVEETHGMRIYLASVQGETVGKVHVQMTGELGGIYGLGILPQFRGLGYGRALLASGIDLLKESGASEIMLQVEAENDKALNLYESCGFVETSVMDYYKLL